MTPTKAVASPRSAAGTSRAGLLPDATVRADSALQECEDAILSLLAAPTLPAADVVVAVVRRARDLLAAVAAARESSPTRTRRVGR